jgi:hypothetical protein
MATKLELEEYLYRRAIEIIESAESDSDKENLLFQEVWCPFADLYKDRITTPKPKGKHKGKGKSKGKGKK